MGHGPAGEGREAVQGARNLPEVIDENLYDVVMIVHAVTGVGWNGGGRDGSMLILGRDYMILGRLSRKTSIYWV